MQDRKADGTIPSAQEAFVSLGIEKAEKVYEHMIKNPPTVGGKKMDYSTAEAQEKLRKDISTILARRFEDHAKSNRIEKPQAEFAGAIEASLITRFSLATAPAIPPPPPPPDPAPDPVAAPPLVPTPELSAEEKELARVTDLVKDKNFLKIAGEELGDNANVADVNARATELEKAQGDKSAEAYAAELCKVLAFADKKRMLGTSFAKVVNQGRIGLDENANRGLDKIYGTYVALTDPDKFQRLQDPKNAKYNPGGRYTNGVKIPETLEECDAIIAQINGILDQRNVALKDTNVSESTPTEPERNARTYKVDDELATVAPAEPQPTLDEIYRDAINSGATPEEALEIKNYEKTIRETYYPSELPKAKAPGAMAPGEPDKVAAAVAETPTGTDTAPEATTTTEATMDSGEMSDEDHYLFALRSGYTHEEAKRMVAEIGRLKAQFGNE